MASATSAATRTASPRLSLRPRPEDRPASRSAVSGDSRGPLQAGAAAQRTAATAAAARQNASVLQSSVGCESPS